MTGQRGRPRESALGRKRAVDVLFTPEEIAFLVATYGSVGKGVRALVRDDMAAASAVPPAVRAPAVPSPQPGRRLCPRCTRIGSPSCQACRGR